MPIDYYKIDKKKYEIQNEPFVTGDIFAFGLFRSNFLSHPNEIDMNLAGIRNRMVILDAGCGLLGTSKYLLKKFDKVKVHAVTNVDGIYKNEIKEIANKNDFNKRLNIYFEDFDNINLIFRKKTFDKILFIESINYSKKVNELLSKCYKLLKNKGQIFIKTLIIPKTTNNFLNKNYDNLREKLNMNLYTNDNIITLLQKNKFKNIKFSNISLFLSEIFNYPLFYLTLKKLKLLSFNQLSSSLPILIGFYIAST
jgi:SAM-dependent methyltransferase